MVAFLFYFSQWLVIENSKPDWWYNAILIISSFIFIIFAPIISRRIDRDHKKINGLRIFTFITFILYLITALITIFTPDLVLLAGILFTLAFSLYLLSFLFYTPMINDISNKDNISFVSGLGQGANFIGQVFGLLFSIPFATGFIHIFDVSNRVQTLLPATLLFGILTLPMLFKYKEDININLIGNNILPLFTTFKKIFSIRNLSFLFIAYFLFSDALLTFSNNFPIFLERVYNASDSMKAYLSIVILLLSSIGSVIFGRIATRKGNKWTLNLILVIWLFIFPMIAFAPTFRFAVVIMMFGGLLFGASFGISRAMVSQFTPREIEASSFSFYIITERFATFIGPIVWSITLASTASMGNISYSYAILSLGFLILISIFVLRKVKV